MQVDKTKYMNNTQKQN